MIENESWSSVNNASRNVLPSGAHVYLYVFAFLLTSRNGMCEWTSKSPRGTPRASSFYLLLFTFGPPPCRSPLDTSIVFRPSEPKNNAVILFGNAPYLQRISIYVNVHVFAISSLMIIYMFRNHRDRETIWDIRLYCVGHLIFHFLLRPISYLNLYYCIHYLRNNITFLFIQFSKMRRACLKSHSIYTSKCTYHCF